MSPPRTHQGKQDQATPRERSAAGPRATCRADWGQTVTAENWLVWVKFLLHNTDKRTGQSEQQHRLATGETKPLHLQTVVEIGKPKKEAEGVYGLPGLGP